jgi:hypothetical protein
LSIPSFPQTARFPSGFVSEEELFGWRRENKITFRPSLCLSIKQFFNNPRKGRKTQDAYPQLYSLKFTLDRLPIDGPVFPALSLPTITKAL